MPKPLPADTLARLQAHAAELKLWELARGSHVGPVTISGKRRSALRGMKHGLCGAGGVEMRRWLRALNLALAQLKVGS